VTLPSVPAVQNHLGTAHAGAVYTAAESATGVAALSLFADVVAQGAYVALKSSTVLHKKARPGNVVAHAVIDADPTALRAEYDNTGKADFEAKVELTVDGVPTASMVFVWAVRKPRS
jgi:acyl-coenzyme A thioesterase PaaI-like protein